MYLQKLQQIANQGHKIAIIGLARENRQFLKWLVEVVRFPTVQILLADQLVEDKLPIDTLEQIQLYDFKATQLFLGDNYLQVLAVPELKTVFKSPGIWSLKPEFEEFRQTHGADSVQSGLVFFFERFREQIVGISGTKGKSTTSSLTAHILNNLEHGKRAAHYCGNTINISPYTHWADLNQRPEENIFYVIEISSFQLQDLGYSQLSPKYAIVTNYYVDHLDQHGDKQEYWMSKDNLFKFQTSTDFKVVTKSVEERSEQKELLANTALTEEEIQTYTSTFQSPLVGEHNWSNVLQAFLTVQEITGLVIRENTDLYQQALNSYQPLPHRLQKIRSAQIGSLTLNFFDDGYATEPDAVAAAVKALSQEENEYLWLQITGKDKGVDVEALFMSILEVQQKVQLFRVDYCGTIGKTVLTTFTNTLGLKPPTETENFHETVDSSFISLERITNNFLAWYAEQWQAMNPFKKVDLNKPLILNVLLSPGGSSFDEFNNQQERAEWWAQKVLNLK